MNAIIRPSSLPALAQCPLYSPDPEVNVAAKTAGTRRHEALAMALGGHENWREGLPESDAEGIEWAVNYIRVNAPSDVPMLIEETGEFVGPDFTRVKGTPDVQAGPHVFDLKGRAISSYAEQMAGYALINGHDPVTVHVLYATERRAAPSYTISKSEASDIVYPIISRVLDPTAAPKINDYCAWCRHRTTCPAVLESLRMVAGPAADSLPPDFNRHRDNPDIMAQCLLVAGVLQEWIDGVRKQALAQALDGLVPTGFKLITRKGDRFIPDTIAAWRASGIESEDFVRTCTISFSDLVDLYQNNHLGLTRKAAENDVTSRLGELIQRKKDVKYLRNAVTSE